MIEGDNPNTELDDKAYGNLTRYRKEKDTLIMKLMYRRNLQPGFRTLWSRQMRNVYSIGQTNVDVNDTRINFWYLRPNNDSADVLDGWSEKLVTVLRVDQVNNNNGELTPDGLFDMGPPRTANPAQQQSGGIPNNQQFNQQSQQTAFFDPIRGEVTFPSLEPFRKGLRDYFRAKKQSAIS
jgi:cell surface protein SprA